ncbi:MAG: hypothetical protein IID37_00900 [Planctomycetes bacterium]|nr:hypothetical protein [Planctomycetota bacterium]
MNRTRCHIGLALAGLALFGMCSSTWADCGEGNGDCCAEGGNGTPGCDDEACCEAICAADPFCCDTSWDGICADSAQKSCEVCQGGGDEGVIIECFGENELCDDAFVINPGDTASGNSCEGAGCNDGSASCGSSDGADVWYTYTASCDDGVVSASTCQDFKDYDTVLSVHSGCPGDVGNEIVCNDDDCDTTDFQSTVTWNVTSGTTYLIRVAGFGGGCGDFDLTLTEDCPPDCDPPCDDGDQCTDDICLGDNVCEFVDNGECCEDCGTCAGDVNCDGMVDPLDSGAVLARFGLDPCNEENCKYDVNCDGAIDPLDSGFVLARFGLCDEPDVCKFEDSCPVEEVFNDNCEDAPVDSLSIGQTLTYNGTLTDATATCAALGSLGETWHAFDLTETATVTGSHCGTDPVFGNAFIVLDPECPCSGAFVFASSFDQFTCDDGNWAIHYAGLPAGDYWSPVILDPGFGNDGPYVWNISAK